MSLFAKSKNVAKYSKVILNKATSYIKKRAIKQEKEFGKVLKNIILDNDSPKILEEESDKEELFIADKLFRPFHEIILSFEVLENIPIYLKTFPFKRKGISEVSYLRYHIENYFNELYLLTQRLDSYIRNIDNGYKKSTQYKNMYKLIQTTKKISSEIIKSPIIIKTRGEHVHKVRYSDNDIDHLSLLDLYTNSEDKNLKKIINLLYKQAFKKIRKKWITQIKNNNEDLIKILDVYFDNLYKIIIKKGEIIIP